MHKLTVIFLLMFLSGFVKSQNIYTVLHLNEEREYKTTRPKKIVEINTFYNPGGKQVDKNIKYFDEAGMLVKEERYDEIGNLEARLTYTNDTADRLVLTRILERWTKFGHSKETAFYTYDVKKFLLGTTNKAANGNTIRQAEVVCNDKGHPVELSLFDGNGNSFGKELAVYLYEKNKVVTSVVSNEGVVLSSDTMKISFINASKYAGDNEIYNANGDLTSWTSKDLNGTETVFEEEYSYDNSGNCTEHRIYKVTVKRNGKRKREIDRIFKKEYTY